MRNIAHLRSQHGISQRELAEKLNLSLPTLQNAEKPSNGVDTRWSTIEKLATYFNVSVDYLMGVNTANTKQESKEGNEFTKEELSLAYDFLRNL